MTAMSDRLLELFISRQTPEDQAMIRCMLKPPSEPRDEQDIVEELLDAMMKPLQDLQEPPTCPTCQQPRTKVYCTSVPDVEVRLKLRARGLGRYAGPCHRIDTGL